jgi:hypothetical protein
LKHALEDTELAFVMMLAACHHQMDGAPFRLRSAVRLPHFGIGRDAYEAHQMLDRLGLAEVTADPGRHPDGKVEGFNDGDRALPHSFRFLPDSFQQEALVTLRKQIEYQLSR